MFNTKNIFDIARFSFKKLFLNNKFIIYQIIKNGLKSTHNIEEMKDS